MPGGNHREAGLDVMRNGLEAPSQRSGIAGLLTAAWKDPKKLLRGVPEDFEMRRSGFLMYLLVVAAGCSQHASALLPAQTQSATTSSSLALPASTSPLKYKLLYSFGTYARDGKHPTAGLVAVNGALYGTTLLGGKNADGYSGAGTMFEVTTAGKERILYNFTKAGANPQTGLLAVGTNLYGVTQGDQIFEVSASTQAERVLQTLGSSDGNSPAGIFVAVNHVLIGTAGFGGDYKTCITGSAGSSNDNGCGTVFALTQAGQIRVLHRFHGSDGATPDAGLVSLNGALYGTTSGKDAYAYANGNVFKILPSGSGFGVVYAFKGGTDGANPEAPLLAMNGALYGTTTAGGTFGGGTVFKLTPAKSSFTESIVYSFAKGAIPMTGLVAVNGVLYGTTERGGAYHAGTVFQLNVSGKFRVLHTFTGGADGARPSELLAYGGALYGTTPSGGAGGGYGTVFQVTL
jgi:uncharacterized repeat protein (TIGR03803 family)